MFTFQQKLKHLKSNLKSWNKREFGNIMEEKLKLENQLQEIQLQAIQMGYSEDLKNKENETQLLLNMIYQQEEELWKQKSRVQWLKEGEKT